MSSDREPWQTIVARKRAQRASSIPQEWLIPNNQLPGHEINNVLGFPRVSGLLSPRELEITESNASSIVHAIAQRSWTSLEVVRAFAHRAAIAQQLLNSLTEIAFDAAFEQAKALDQYQAEHGHTIGPLHGLPMSFKDSCDVKGLDTSMGYTAWVGHVAAEDSVVAAAMRAAGAVPFVKTNVGFTLMMGETVNHLFGRTLNPYNRALTSGGSSGGESALLAFRGSPFGVGTDIGGSIRLPAASTGLWGLRPSIGRVSYMGIANSLEGLESVRSNAGPMGHSPSDIRLFFSALLSSQPWLRDPDVLPIPWRAEQEILPDKLCFAYSVGDEVVTPHPPIRRGLAHTIDKLRAAGHEVVEWTDTFDADRAGRLMIDFWTSDGGEDVRRCVEASGEPMIDEVAALLRLTPEDQKLPKPTVYQAWRNQHERVLYAREFLARWQTTGKITSTGRPVDALIMPSAPFVARPHGADLPSSRFGMFEYTYANFQPILDLTAGVFPTGVCQDPAIDLPDTKFTPRSDLDMVVHNLYTDPQEWTGAPVGLQLIGRRLEEEKITALLGVVEKALA
ncbi:hypothetical protein PLICRDRAFT_232733 [Plicaturopsis crispa FD-325 SS-3]|nr:hypothetical protein PLICRDRAFT_232733 [Plicaturopsis crispa FD-325 SS-3]